MVSMVERTKAEGIIAPNKYRKLKQRLESTGYLYVNIRNREGREIGVGVHRLVLEAFCGPCPEGMEGCHGDGCRSNNHLTNLRWATHADNGKDMILHGRNLNGPVGEKHGGAKLKNAEVEDIRNLWGTGRYTQSYLATLYKVYPSCISRIVNRVRRNRD